MLSKLKNKKQQKMEKVAIPVGMDFSELRLARLPKGGVSFDWSVIERVCQASGLPVGLFQDAPEDNLSELIVGWYQAHLQQGGERNPVADDLFYEVLLEESADQPVSHQPGHG